MYELEKLIKKIAGKYIPKWEDLNEEEKIPLRMAAMKYEIENLKYYLENRHLHKEGIEVTKFCPNDVLDEFCAEKYNFTLTLFRDNEE